MDHANHNHETAGPHTCSTDDGDISQISGKGISLNSNEPGIGSLHVASALGAVNIVNTLLQDGAEVDTNTTLGWTPLMYAARNGHLKVVQQLIEQRANIQHRNKLGITILAMAAASGNIEVIAMLLNKLQGTESLENEIVSSLLIAALYGYSNILNLLGSTHPHFINGCDKYGVTPLMLAVAGGHEEATSSLLKAGADPDLENSHCFTALDIALMLRHSNIIHLLTSRSRKASGMAHINYMPLGVGSNLVEEYGWSSTCSPVPKRDISLQNFSKSCRETPLNPIMFPVNVITSSDSDISHVPRENRGNCSLQFVSLYPPSYKDSPVASSNSALRNMSLVKVKSSLHVPVPPLSPYSNSPPFNFLQSTPQRKHKTLETSTLNDHNPIQSIEEHSLTKQRNNNKNYSTMPPDLIQKNCNKSNTKVNDRCRIRLWWSEKVKKRLQSFMNSWQKKIRFTDDFQDLQRHSTDSLVVSNIYEADTQLKLQTFERSPSKECTNAPSSASCTLMGFLGSHQLQAYVPLFLKHEVDMDSFLMLSQADLEEMGITSPRGQSKLLGMIKTFNRND